MTFSTTTVTVDTVFHRVKNAAAIVIFLVTMYALTALVFYFAISKYYTPIKDFYTVRFIILLLFAPIIIKYIFHLAVAPWYPVVEASRSRKRSTNYTPSVSVLIPAWNEEVGIRATITSVLKTRYQHLEIIVVNDGSTDRTHEIVRAFIAEYQEKYGISGTPIYYKRIQNGGKARALNTALAMAQNDIIITIDADSVMDHRAIKNLVKHFNDPRVASVAGNVVIGNRTKPIGFIQQLEYVYGFYFKRADSLLNAVYIVGGAAAAYRKKILIMLRGFDESAITEDIELSTRLQYNGYQVRYAADATVYTEGPSDFIGLCRQRLRWKFGRLHTFYKYRRLFFSTDRKHNFYLSFFILPLALFAEVLLFFEGILLVLFYLYTFYTNDFVPLALVILLLAGVVCMQILTDRNRRYHRNLLALAPIAWILFYFMDVVEYQALMRSIQRLMTKEKLLWQKWIRVGVFVDIQKEV